MIRPLPLVRYGYYAFIISIPFETLDIGIGTGDFSLSKVVGYVFIAVALSQPALCFQKPPKALWYFGVYLLAYACLGAFQPSELMGTITAGVFRLGQLLVLFWISYALLQHKEMTKGTLLALSGSCLVLSVLQLSGQAASGVAQNRVSALGENANQLGAVLSLGALAILGVAYGRAESDPKMGLLSWICIGSLAAGIVMTGSRGAALSFMGGLLFLLVKTGRASSKMKMIPVAVLVIGALAWMSYENDLIRYRWERALWEGNLAGREKVMPEAWEMFTDKPLIGWGPVSHHLELGARFGEPSVDTHNLYLWILTETGLLGGVPFFIGLWLCWRAAWRARQLTEGTLPVALAASMFLVNMTGTMHIHKLFWFVLAYAAASGDFAPSVSNPVRSIREPRWGLNGVPSHLKARA